jgi:hypothetical protein
MLYNDPTKSEFYNRCPLFGDLEPIEATIGDDNPDLSNCLNIINEVRSWLIIPFIPHDPLSPNTYSIINGKIYTHSMDRFGCLNGSPFPSPEKIEELIGYPATYLKAFRGIYIKVRDIESCCLDRFSRAAGISYALSHGNFDERSSVRRALGIDGDRAVDVAKSTLDNDYEAKGVINHRVIFFLFALKYAMEVIHNELVYGKSGGAISYSQELYQAATIYLRRAVEIVVEEEKAEVVRKKAEEIRQKAKDAKERLIHLEQAAIELSKIRSDWQKNNWAGARGEPYRKRNAEYKKIAEMIIREKTKAHHKLFYPPPPKQGWKSYIIKKIAEELTDEKYAKEYEEDQKLIKKEKFKATENSIREIFKGKKRKNGIKTENMLDEIYKNIVWGDTV